MVKRMFMSWSLCLFAVRLHFLIFSCPCRYTSVIMVCLAFHLQLLIWIFLMTAGLQVGQHEVTHLISSMCVVRQSTVLIPCKYSYPPHERLNAVEWLYRKKAPEESVRVVFLDPVFEGRVESVGDGGGNCSLLLRDVRDDDAGVFYFAFTTDKNRTSSRGVNLQITNANVEVISQSDVVMEGDWLVFFCGSCIPSIIVPTYIWRKDGHVYRQEYGTNQLDLNSVRLEDGGQYSCMLSGHERLNSSSVTVSVSPGYPPRNTSVSIILSEEKGPVVSVVTLVVMVAVVITSVILLVAFGMCIRKRRRMSEVQTGTGLQLHRKIESPEDTYMTLDPKSVSSDYDTLDNVKRSSDDREP